MSYIGVREQGASPYGAAVSQGYFTREGLKFEPTWATSGTVILDSVVAGDSDVGNVGPAQLYGAIRNGACVRVLRPIQGAAYALLAQPTLHLDTARPYPQVLAQLRGKTLGVAARGAAQELVFRSLLKDAGMNPDTDVTWLAIGGGPQATAVFATRKVDVVMGVSQTEVQLGVRGIKFDKLLDLTGSDSPAGPMWQAVAIANCGWVDKHRETVLAFCHAMNQGFDALASDPAVGPEAFVYANVATNIDQAKVLWAKYGGPLTHIPSFDERHWSYQGRFTADGYVPSYSKYVVAGCATA